MRMMQIDGEIRNVSSEAVENFRMEIVPPGKCLQIWNLKEIEAGRIYGIVDYLRDHGGLQPQQELKWGGIFCSPYVNFVLSQRI